MMAGLIAGTLHGAPTTRTTKTGKQYVQALLRATTRDGAEFVTLRAFTPTTQAALLALGNGDALAVTGDFQTSTWMDKTGSSRVQIDFRVLQVLTLLDVQTKRDAIRKRDLKREPVPPTPDWTTTPPPGWEPEPTSHE